VFDSQTDNVNLVSTAVPSGALDYSTTCYWRVRHQDDHGAWSEWSAETSFVTATAPSTPPEEPDDVTPTEPSTPPDEPDDSAPAEPVTPPDEPDDTSTAPALPDAERSPGFLPFILAVAAGVAAVAMVGSGIFLAYMLHVRSVNKPKGLNSARTISKRLRK
jgi:hypothetical protein